MNATEAAQTVKFDAIIALGRKYLPRGTRNVELDVALKSMDHNEYQAFLSYRTEKGI